MDQLSFEKGLIGGLGRLYAEFGDRLTPGQLLAFLNIIVSPDISVAQLGVRLGVRRWRAQRYVHALSAPRRWWQRRHGLIRTYRDATDARTERCALTLKGALVARGFYLLAAIEAGTFKPEPMPDPVSSEPSS